MDYQVTPISFEQLPSAVAQLMAKVDYLIGILGEKGSNQPKENNHVLMALEEAAAFINKATATIYSLTSKRQIPFRKRGNKLYFFKDELLAWIENGGKYDAPFNPESKQDKDFETHLAKLRQSKCRKPKAVASVA